MGPYPPRVTVALRAPANERLTNGIGISTPCGVVSARENSIFVLGVSELQGYGRMPEPGWGPILPGLPSHYAPQSIGDRLVGLAFSHRAGRCRPGRIRFSSLGCRSCRGMEGCLNRMGPCPPRVAVALRAPKNQRSARGNWVSAPCGAVSTRENSIFRP